MLSIVQQSFVRLNRRRLSSATEQQLRAGIFLARRTKSESLLNVSESSIGKMEGKELESLQASWRRMETMYVLLAMYDICELARM